MSETCRVLINQVKQAASRWLFTYTMFETFLEVILCKPFQLVRRITKAPSLQF